MIQLKIIDQLKKMFPIVTGIDVALLYGSFGRNEATPNSDIDIQLLVSIDFETTFLKDQLQRLFNTEIQSIREVALRNKVVVYFKSLPKIEFAICTCITEIDRNYLGSAITDFSQTILFQRESQHYDIGSYLAQLIRDNNNHKTAQQREKQIDDLVDKFIYEFESCSSMHRRSDGYQFYFFYNIALQLAIQLNYFSKGHSKFNFLPKNFITNILTKEEQATFHKLKGSLFLPEANQQKRYLLEFFYASIETLITPEKLKEVKQLCEWIYDRDFLWNFRDISTHNSRIKSGRIYRSSALSRYQNESRFVELIRENQIKTVIDLRANQEIEELPYHEETLSKFNYVKAQLDPWNQPEWFKEKHHQGTNEEIAYRFFTIGCNNQIKSVMEAIISEESGAVAIHCVAGKDRTGIIVSLLHLLVEKKNELIHVDYLASEMDVEVNRLNLVLDIINEKGGIESYLLSCGLTNNQISKLKQKLLN